jgi:hypothetical protein
MDMATRMAPVLLAVALAAAQPPSAGQPPPTLLTLARHDLLNQALYRRPDRLVSHVAPSGAVSVNADWERSQRGPWFIEQQRYGADLVQAGVVLKDRGLIGQGWKILAWGLNRQARDGGFPGTGDPFHSTAMYVEGAARALLLQKQSSSDSAREYLDRYLAPVTAAARWLMEPDVAAHGRKHNEPYTHRRWLLAAALGQAADLCGDPRMAQAAAEYAREGLALQRPDGVNPEKGSGDASYQGFGLLLAERYYLVCSDARLRGEVRQMIGRGLQWELTRVEDDGTVSLAGNSRVGKERGRSGKPKTVDYKGLLQAFLFGAAITGNPRYEQVAQRIAAGRHWVGRDRTSTPSLANTGKAPLVPLLEPSEWSQEVVPSVPNP